MKISPLSDDDCKVFKVEDIRYCYVPITKVSSSYLRTALPGDRFNIHTWQWYNDIQQPVPDRGNMNYLVVLRDPVERWISGVVEFWCRAYPTHSWDLSQENYDWLFDQIEFDVHTRPQVDFLHAVDKQKCTWLRMTDSIENDPWFRQNSVTLGSVQEQDKNRGSSRPLIYFDPETWDRSYENRPGYVSSVPSAKIYATVSHLIQSDSARVERIQRYYQADYDLINSLGI